MYYYLYIYTFYLYILVYSFSKIVFSIIMADITETEKNNPDYLGSNSMDVIDTTVGDVGVASPQASSSMYICLNVTCYMLEYYLSLYMLFVTC